MSFNYRVVNYKETGGLGLVEMCYDEDGEPKGWTPPLAVGEDLAEIRVELERMMEATNNPVLEV